MAQIAGCRPMVGVWDTTTLGFLGPPDRSLVEIHWGVRDYLVRPRVKYMGFSALGFLEHPDRRLSTKGSVRNVLDGVVWGVGDYLMHLRVKYMVFPTLGFLEHPNRPHANIRDL
jgi:hypothetical protein